MGYNAPMTPKADPDRLKLDCTWEEAAERLLKTPRSAIPPRTIKPRKPRAKGRKTSK